jgi:thioredoxin-related protein
MRFSARFLALALLLAPAAGVVHAAEKAGVKAQGPQQSKPSVQWVSLEDAVKRASATKKYIFVTVYTDWCGYCRKLNTVTLRAQPVVAELDKNFQSVRVNAESDKPVVWKGKKMSEAQVAKGSWGVTGFPTMLFISPKGEVIGSYSAYAEPEFMVQLLTYISSGARERKVSFDDFLEGKG